MVPAATILACVATLTVSLLLPLGALIFCALRWRKQGVLTAWLLGAAGFFVPQMLIRLPVMTVLSGTAWFTDFSYGHPFLYALTLAFTAGLFELVGRYAGAQILKKKLTWRRALALGMGHGGIEAIVLVGMAYVNNLTYIAMINSGAFDTLLTQLPPEQAVQLAAVKTSLLGTAPDLFLLAGLERLLAMVAQTAMSAVVCWGVHTGKTGKGILLCLGIHTFIDLTAGISLLATDMGGKVLSQGAAYGMIYAVLTATAILSALLLRKIRRQWQELPGKEAIL